MNSSMGERLAWARNQQELILQQVSDRSGLAIGYISQLEKGSKNNPTIDALGRLAKALHVTVAFLMGEIPEPDHDDRGAILISGQAWTIGQRFRQFFGGLPGPERQRLTFLTVEQRFGMVVAFICREFNDTFTHAVVAYQLGLSVRGLNDILERGCEVAPLAVSQLSTITGVPLIFFHRGQLEYASEVASPGQLMQYAEAVALAAQANISPDQLAILIRDVQGRK